MTKIHYTDILLKMLTSLRITPSRHIFLHKILSDLRRPEKIPMRFWFVRHGESCHKAAGLFCGSVDSPLTEKGYRKAHRHAGFFADKACDWIATSPLQRAYDNAELIANQQGLKILVDERLRGHTKGELENQPYKKMRSQEWNEVNGAEPIEELYDRTIQALTHLSHIQGVGIIVSHARIAKIIEAIRTQTPITKLDELPKVKNSTPYLVEISKTFFANAPYITSEKQYPGRDPEIRCA